jgi:hypothetical protein
VFVAGGSYLLEIWSNGAPQSRSLVRFDTLEKAIEARRIPLQAYLFTADGASVRNGAPTFPGPTVFPGRYVVRLFGHELRLDAYSAGFLRLTVDGARTTELPFSEHSGRNFGSLGAPGDGLDHWDFTLDPATSVLHAVLTPPHAVKQDGSIRFRMIDLH